MAGILKPEKYLSSEAISKISFAISKQEKDLDKQAFLLKDGTVIYIERSPDLVTNSKKTGTISNPNDINIVDKCKATISYIIGTEENDVTFIVNSPKDLESKWLKYKSVKEYPADLIGTLEKISITDEEKAYIVKLEYAMNTVLNLLTEDEVTLGPDDLANLRLTSRYQLINFVITNITENLLKLGIVERIHLPHVQKTENGYTTDIRNHADYSSLGRDEYNEDEENPYY